MPGWKAPLVAKAIVEVLAPTIIGEEALAIQRLWRKLVDATHWTQNGIGMGVISGIEMALWDLKGKHLGVPVHELLGGWRNPACGSTPAPAPATGRCRPCATRWSGAWTWGTMRSRCVWGLGRSRRT